jgi:hypothetical protein
MSPVGPVLRKKSFVSPSMVAVTFEVLVNPECPCRWSLHASGETARAALMAGSRVGPPALRLALLGPS